MKEILFFEVTFASLSKSTGKSSVCLHLAVCVLGCKPRAVLIFSASRGSVFPRGSWGFSPPNSLIERTESGELALPFKEFPSILQDRVFALLI